MELSDLISDQIDDKSEEPASSNADDNMIRRVGEDMWIDDVRDTL